MRIAKVWLLVFVFVLAAAAGALPPRCSDSAPCFTIANRPGSAALAVKSSNVASVYQNGRLLTKGLGADYHVATGTHGKSMVIVHMPSNTTGKPELFQAIVK